MDAFRYKVFSYGAGTQSTALMLLIKHQPQRLIDAVGHLPDVAYFADTQAESPRVYANLEKMMQQSPIPLRVVTRGSILAEQINEGLFPLTTPPYFTRFDGRLGQIRRKCTTNFKITPIHRQIKADIGLVGRQRGKQRSVALWKAISVEEIERMGDNPIKLYQNVFPLVELRLDRLQCTKICLEYGFEPIKSRCLHCPYIPPSEWQHIKQAYPDDFESAVEIDRRIRNITRRGETFVHPACKPLDVAVSDQMHLLMDYETGFRNECAGVCGV